MEENKEAQLKNELTTIDIIYVVDEITRREAQDIVLNLKSIRKRIVDYWDPIKTKAYQVHKEIKAKENEMLDQVDKKINVIDSEIKSYLRKQEEIRRAEQRRFEEEANKKAEEERTRIEAEKQKQLDECNIEEAIELETQKENIIPFMPKQESISKTFHTESGSATQKKEIEVTIIDPNVFFKFCAANNLAYLWDIKLGLIKKWVKDNNLKDIPGLNITDDIKLSYRTK